MPALPLRTKILYGSGDLSFSLTATFVGAYFSIFLTDVAAIPAGIAALVIFIARSCDYLNDPVIGFLTDRTRTHWGRRRPFFIWGAIPFGLSFSLLWLKPVFPDPLLLAAYYVVVLILFDIAATFVYLPYYALTPELTDDYDERTSLTSFRMAFSIIASLAVMTLPLLFLGTFSPTASQKIGILGAIVGGLAAIPVLVLGLGIRERQKFAHSRSPGIRESLLSALHNPVFRFTAAIFLLTWLAIDVLQASILYYIKYVVRRDNAADLLLATIFLVALLSIVFWNYLSAKTSKRLAYIIGISIWLVSQLCLLLTGPQTPLGLLVVICALAGLGLGAGHVLPWAMLPDSVEAGELETRKRTEGAYYSLVTLAQKVASSIAIPLVLLSMAAFGYVSASEVQSDQAVLGIRLVIGIGPALLLSAGIVTAAFFRHNRATHSAILQTLHPPRVLPAHEPGGTDQ